MESNNEKLESEDFTGDKTTKGNNRLQSFILGDCIPLLLIFLLTSWLTIKASEIIEKNRPLQGASISKVLH